jgi:hypothetical protein
MSSYTYASGGGNTNLPKNYYIVGSTDGTTWYPIQLASMTTIPCTTTNTPCTTYIIVNQSGTQTIQGNQTGSGTFTTYSTTTNAYTYFRMIATTTYGGNVFELEEWYINFTAYTPPLLNALTMSSTGQYLALTGSASVSPNLTGLAAASWSANGVGWTASQSSGANGGSYTGYYAFNNALTAPDWASRNDGTNSYLGTPGVPTGTCPVTSNVTGLPSGTTVTAEWLQIQSSVPLIMNSYIGSAGGGVGYAPRTYYILGSNDNVNWYNIQYVSINTNPYNTTFTSYSPAIIVNSTGSQSITGQIAAVATTTATSYSANAYTYFRICITSVFSGAIAELGEWYINFQGGPTYLSTNYGATWTTPLGYVPYSYYTNAPAVTLPNANLLAISGNGQYMLQGTNLTVQLITVSALAGSLLGVASTPTFSPALTATVNCASISLTGQYMSVLTQGTTNNVYYSTNYGVSFTGLTVGSSPMTGCAISNDGSYLTVSNATTMYTLNLNAQGYAVTLGNQSGQTNQGSNAIAIGNQAGQTNQSANSIVLNASGAALNTYASGFYVAPIAAYGSSTSAAFALLGYGADNQVVQTSVTVNGAGATTLGAYVMPAVTSGTTFGATALVGQFGGGTSNYWGSLACNVIYGNTSTGWTQYTARLQRMVDGVSMAYIDFTPYLSTDYNAIAFGYGSATGGKENMRITGSGNVGIGTTNPGAILQVYNGNATYTAAPTVTISDGAADNGGAFGMVNLVRQAGTDTKAHLSLIRNGNYLIHMGYYQGTNTFGFSSGLAGMSTAGCVMSFAGANVGIGTTTPSYPLDVNCGTSGRIDNISWRNNSYSLGLLGFSGANNGYFDIRNAGSRVIVMRGDGSGSIGIGTDPSSQLHLYGTNPTITVSANAFGSATNTLLFQAYDTSRAGYIQFYEANSTGYDVSLTFGIRNTYGSSYQQSLIFKTYEVERMRISATGYVGIGTADPKAPLHVNGSTTFGISGGSNTFYLNSNSSQPLVLVNSSGVYDWHVGGQNDGTFRIFAGAYNGVQVGWAGTSWSAISDRRLKEDIEPLMGCLSNILSLNPVSYRMINRPSTLIKKQYGLIAQDVLDVIPDIVESSLNSNTNESYYSLLYTEIIPFLIGAIKEQNETILTQASQLTAVLSRLAALESK